MIPEVVPSSVSSVIEQIVSAKVQNTFEKKYLTTLCNSITIIYISSLSFFDSHATISVT